MNARSVARDIGESLPRPWSGRKFAAEFGMYGAEQYSPSQCAGAG